MRFDGIQICSFLLHTLPKTIHEWCISAIARNSFGNIELKDDRKYYDVLVICRNASQTLSSPQKRATFFAQNKQEYDMDFFSGESLSHKWRTLPIFYNCAEQRTFLRYLTSQQIWDNDWSSNALLCSIDSVEECLHLHQQSPDRFAYHSQKKRYWW